MAKNEQNTLKMVKFWNKAKITSKWSGNRLNSQSFELSLVLILDWNSKVCIFYNYCMKWPKWKNIDAEVTNNTGSRSKATIWPCQMVAWDRAPNTPPSQFVHKCNKNSVSNHRDFSQLTPFSIKISNVKISPNLTKNGLNRLFWLKTSKIVLFGTYHWY